MDSGPAGDWEEGVKSKELMGFDEFRRGLEKWTQQQLNAERPAYVSAFRAEVVFSANLPSARHKAEPFLGKALSWMPLLTRTLDVEMARDRLKLATFLSGTDPPDESIERGLWVVHQSEVWVICASGLLERIHRLVVSTCRMLISDPVRREKTVNLLKSEIGKQKGRVKDMRDAVAHGGGHVETLEAKRLWEVHLILGVDGFRDVINKFHESCADKQSSWHIGFSDVTSQLLLDADTWFDQLAKEVF